MEDQELKQHKNKKTFIGLAFLAVGAVLLSKQFGVAYPQWLFTWPMILIVIGLVKAAKHKFNNTSWLLILLIGGVFLAEKIDPSLSVVRFTWPILLIGIGIWCLFGKSHHHHCDYNGRRKRFRGRFRYAAEEAFQQYDQEKKKPETADEYNGNDVIDSVAVFGGTKNTVLSKNFKGGEIVTFMGGTELNLSQADIQDTAVIEVVQVFGGTKIVIPQSWEVSTEMAAIFGGIDDKRIFAPQAGQSKKVLIIKGTSIFGGIEIKSY